MTAPVAVVGAGPAGATASLLLARRGIRTTVHERRESPLFHPAAHVINARSLEIWNSYDPELARSIAALSPPHESVNLISWYGNLDDPPIGSIDLLSDPERKAVVESQSPFMVSHIGQHILMPVLWDALEADPLIDFRRGADVDPVRAVNDRLGAEFLLACDGANSAVRDAAGITMSGPVLANMGSAFFTCETLFPDDARPLLTWIYTPELCGVLIAHADHRYILMTAYLHPAQDIATDSRRFWIRTLPTVLGTNDFELESTGTWVMTSQLADRFRDGRLLLLGDAAHRFPHTGGFGLNSGVQDAHNLAWKLDAVLSGAASPALLDTYDAERRPAVEKFADQSVANHFKLDDIGDRVGITNAMLAKATRLVARQPLRSIPGAVAAPIATAATRRQMKRSRRLNRHAPGSDALRQEIAAAIPDQVEHFVSTGLQFGYLYGGPLVAHDDATTPPEDVVDYFPTTYPGARLPHAILGVEGRSVAAHDALDENRLTLFTFAGSQWSRAVSDTAMPEPGVAVVEIEDEAAIDLYEVGSDGAVLVRPDGHVAWRTTESARGGLQDLLDFVGTRWGDYYEAPAHATQNSLPSGSPMTT